MIDAAAALDALDRMRRRMGAPLIDIDGPVTPDVPELIDWIAPTKAIDIDDNIEPGPDGEIIVNGKRAIIYIQDTWHSRWVLENTPEVSKKYHLFHCHTIETMVQNGRFERYVATLRRNGTFTVHSKEQNRTSHTVEAKLLPCLHCLRRTKFTGPPSSFELEAYLSSHGDEPSGGRKPRTWDTHERPSNYPENWKEISRATKARHNHRCNQCRVQLKDQSRLLDAHHINGVKADNKPANLVALCKICHGEQPNHGHMRVAPKDAQAIRECRRQQGIR